MSRTVVHEMNKLERMLRLTSAASVASEHLDAAGGSIQDLDEPYRTFLAVWSAQGLIDNGSMTHFFESDFPGNPSYSVFIDAYRQIGADNAAICLEKAVVSFPFDHPERQIDKRKEFMDAHYDEKKFTVGFWDHSFAGEETVFEKLLSYVESNPGAFHRKEEKMPWWRFWGRD